MLFSTIKDRVTKESFISVPAFVLILVGAGVIVGGFLLWNLFEKNQQNLRFSEVKNYEIYTLEDAIKWFKSNQRSFKEKGCLLKQKLSVGQGYKIHHCFVDHNREPLLNSNDPQLVVNTSKISNCLEELFSGKDMVILQ